MTWETTIALCGDSPGKTRLCIPIRFGHRRGGYSMGISEQIPVVEYRAMFLISPV
jgi:hypothetical protein